MTAYPPVIRCARCGALDTAHELRTDGRTRGKRLGQTATSEGNEMCAGFVAGDVVELVDAGELRRRLDAVLALHVPVEATTGKSYCRACDPPPWRGPVEPVEHPCPTVRAARGEA